VGKKYAALYVVDANVLIDYSNTDLSILTLVAAHVSEVFVPSPLLSEVDGLDEAGCASANIQVVTPTLAQANEAANRRPRVLSFQDHLCLVVARDNSGACVTNDRRLRSECATLDIETIWGLELLLQLVGEEALTPDQAIEMAKAIQKTNPFITDKIVVDLGKKVGGRPKKTATKGGTRKRKS